MKEHSQKFNELFNDVLEFLSDKQEYKTRDVKEELSKILDLTDDERQQLIPSGTEQIIKNLLCSYIQYTFLQL